MAGGLGSGRADGAPRRRRAALWLVVAAAGLAVVAVRLGPETAVEAGRLASEGLPPAPAPRVVAAEPAPPRPADPLSAMPPALVEALTAAEARWPQPFRFRLAVPPADICGRLAAAGLANGGWRRIGEEWQCASDLVPIPSAAARPAPGERPGRPSTLFVDARGPAEDRLAVLRFKLNLDDPSVDAAGRERLLAIVDGLAGALAWSLPAAAAEAVRRHGKLSMADRGVVVEVHPEDGPVRRVNLVLLLEAPATRLPSDRFVPLPPFEPAPPPGR